MLSDYIVTSRDLFNVFRRMILGISLHTILGELLLVLVTSGLFFLWGWSLEVIFFTVFALAAFYWKFKSRNIIFIGIAFMGLVIAGQILASSLISLPLQEWSEQSASWGFYFISLGVIKKLFETMLEQVERLIDD